ASWRSVCYDRRSNRANACRLTGRGPARLAHEEHPMARLGDTSKRFIVGISGASGALYAERTLVALASTRHQVEIVPSKVGAEIFRQERQQALDRFVQTLAQQGARMRTWDPQDFYAPFSSGSQPYDGMVVVPCSGGALGRIAFGTSPDLVSRAADVCLK